MNKYQYSPFGETPSLSGTIFGFTGQRYDSEIGLYNYKARYYAPAVGRFIQPDPLGYGAGDMNLQCYVGNDPLNMVDPLGLQCGCDATISANGGEGDDGDLGVWEVDGLLLAQNLSGKKKEEKLFAEGTASVYADSFESKRANSEPEARFHHSGFTGAIPREWVKERNLLDLRKSRHGDLS